MTFRRVRLSTLALATLAFSLTALPVVAVAATLPLPHVYKGPPRLRPVRDRVPMTPRPNFAGEARTRAPNLLSAGSPIERLLLGGAGKRSAPGEGGDDGTREDFAKDSQSVSVFSVNGADHLIDASSGASNYVDDQGQWRTLDTTLVHDDSAGGYRPAATDVGVFLPDVLGAKNPVTEQLVNGQLSLVPEGVPDGEAAKVDGNVVTYPGAALGGDLAVWPTGTGSEAGLFLPKPPDTDSLAWDLQAQGLTLTLDKTGAIEIDAGGTQVGLIPLPTATDSSDGKAGGTSTTFGYELKDYGDGAYVLLVLMDAKWLQDPARIYPVFIDPSPQTLYTTDSGDTFTADNTGSTSEGGYQNIQVGGSQHALAYATFSGVKHTDRVLYSAQLATQPDEGSGQTDTGTINVRGTTTQWTPPETGPGSLTHNSTAPSVTSVLKSLTGPTSGWYQFDVGSYLSPIAWDPNSSFYGFRFDTQDVYWHVWFSKEASCANLTQGHVQDGCQPQLILSYDTLPTWPGGAALSGPSGGQTITTDMPALSVTAMPTDSVDGDSTRVDYQVSTDPNTWDYTTIVAESGWLNCTGQNCATMPVWTPPSGALHDGATYYWRALAGDWCVWPSPTPASICPNVDAAGTSHPRHALPQSSPPSFRVSLPHYGTNAAWSMWDQKLGNGMSLDVNEANGNLVLDYPVESLATPVGPLDVGLTYNSRVACWTSCPPYTGLQDQGVSPGWTIAAGVLSDSSELPIQLTPRSDDQGGGVDMSLNDGGIVHFSQVANDSNHYSGGGQWSGVLTKSVQNGQTTGWSLTLGGGGRFLFDGSGKLTSAAPSTGSWAQVGLQYSYDTSTFSIPVLSYVQDPLGRKVSFGWNSSGTPRLQTMTTWVPCVTTSSPANCDGSQPPLERWTFNYDGNSRLSSVTDAGGNVVQFAYDGNGLLNRITDASSLATTIAYATSSTGMRVQTVAAPAGTDPVSNPSGPSSWPGPTWFCYQDNSPLVGDVVARTMVIDPRAGTTVCPSTPFTTQGDYATLASFDVGGRMMETDDPPEYDPNGVGHAPITRVVYDGQGNPLCRMTPYQVAAAQGAGDDGCYVSNGSLVHSQNYETDYSYQATAPYLVTQQANPKLGAQSAPTWTYHYDGGLSGLVRHTYDTMYLVGPEKEERIDPTIDFGGASGTPHSPHTQVFCPSGQTCYNYGSSYWSIQWTGTITPTGTGTEAFKFRTVADMGVRVTIGEDGVVDCYTPDAQTQNHDVNQQNCGGTTDPVLTLQGGKAYPITITYYWQITNGSDYPVMQLMWQPPGGSFATVPSSAFGPGLNLKTSEDAPAPAGYTGGSTVTTTWSYPNADDELHHRPTSVSVGNQTTDYQYDATYGYVTETDRHLQNPGHPDTLLKTTSTYNTNVANGGFCLSQVLDPAENAAKDGGQSDWGHTGYLCDQSGEVTKTSTYLPVITGVPHQPATAQTRSVLTVFDNVGRVVGQSVPYLDGVDSLPPCSPGSCSGSGWTSYTYDGALRVLTTKDPLGNVTTNEYNAQGLLKKVTEPDPDGGGSLTSPVTWTGYDAAGNRSVVYDARGTGNGDSAHRWSWAYDGGDDVITTTVPTGTSPTDTSSYQVTTAYDLPNRRVITTTPGGPGVGSGGISDAVAYDPMNNKVSEQNGSLTATTYTYDAIGDVASQATPGQSGNVQTTFVYDALGARVKSTCVSCDTSGQQPQDAVTSWTYDWAGRMTKMTDARNNDWAYAYDASGRLVEADLPTVSDNTSGNGHFTYTYNAAGDLIRVVDGAGYSRVFTFDTYHPNAGTPRTEFAYNPDGATYTKSLYDLDGRLTEADLPGGVATRTYTYDALGRVTKRVGVAGATTTELFGYDPSGNETSACTVGTAAQQCDLSGHPQQTLSFSYDNGNRLLTAGAALGTSTQAKTTYAYQGSQTATRTDAYGQSGIGFAYTSATSFNYRSSDGLLSSLTWTPDAGTTNDTSTFSYSAGGLLLSRADPSQFTTSYGYDNANRLASVSVAPSGGGSAVASFGRVYDATGNVISETRNVSGYPSNDNVTWSYGIDADGRLNTATPGSGNTYTYKYDGAGNRTEVAHGSSDLVTSYDSNAYPDKDSNAGGGSVVNDYTYDAAGELGSVVTGTKTTTYTYDGFSRLTEAKKVNNGSTSWDDIYTIDPLDRTAVRSPQTGGSVTTYGLIGAGEDIAFTKDSAISRYIWGQDGVLGELTSNGTRYYLESPHDDVVALADASTHSLVANKVWAYDPWGSLRSGPNQVLYGFQGDSTDADTGFVDMGAREYDPTEGRFATRDSLFGSLSNPTSLDQWIYGGDNPVTMIDPDGNCPAGYACIDGVYYKIWRYHPRYAVHRSISYDHIWNPTPAQRRMIAKYSAPPPPPKPAPAPRVAPRPTWTPRSCWRFCGIQQQYGRAAWAFSASICLLVCFSISYNGGFHAGVGLAQFGGRGSSWRGRLFGASLLASVGDRSSGNNVSAVACDVVCGGGWMDYDKSRGGLIFGFGTPGVFAGVNSDLAPCAVGPDGQCR